MAISEDIRKHVATRELRAFQKISRSRENKEEGIHMDSFCLTQ